MSTDNETAYWADVAARYQRAIRLFDMYIEPVLQRLGYSQLGLSHVLFLINIGDQPRRVADLIRDHHYPGSNASYALSHLVEANLISRETDASDARVRVVCVTELGRQLLAAIRESSAGSPRQIGAALKTLEVFEAKISASLPASALPLMPLVSTPAEAAE